MQGTATYSPEDNKLRLYPSHRLPEDVYRRVKDAGFSWAPKQELFVAPMWTPEREDLLIELCGEIGDEDKSLVERAEERSDRFRDYSAARTDDAEQAHKAVHAIADRIPFGQPILVGHHSERHARKDAERIENGMRKAVSMWETALYWKERAAGAVRAAKYKERPDVRARRIKRLEAELRGMQRRAERPKLKAYDFLARDTDGNPIKNSEGKLTLDKPRLDAAIAAYKAEQWSPPTWVVRWIAHYDNRLAYERAMLAADGGTVTDRKGPEKGGACRCWASPRGGWSYIQKVNKVSVTILDNWGNGGGNFTRTIPFDKLAAVMTAAEVQEARDCGILVEVSDKTGFVLRGSGQDAAAARAMPDKPEDATKAAMEAMRETLKAGVQVVSAPQLFPTPPALAQRMVDCAGIQPGDRVLEPSAGTGNIVEAIRGAGFNGDIHLDCIEINRNLCRLLESKGIEADCRDFLEVSKPYCPDAPDGWDRILMNPPFERGSDITHIQHALTLLKPGGRLVAICANGTRQREALEPLATEWHDLPEGTFKEQGTNVNTALVVIDKD